MLDAWAGDTVAFAKRAYAEAFDAAREAAHYVARAQKDSCASAAQVEEARFTLQRIEELNPSQDEYDELLRELPRIENAETLAQATHESYRGLAGDGGAIESVNAAVCSLERLVQVDPALEPVARCLSDASYILEDAAHDLRAYRDSIEHDPAACAQVQDRIGALQGLMRTYGPRMEDVLARRDAAQRLIASVEDAGALLAEAVALQQRAEEDLAACAQALDDARAHAIPEFAAAVNAQMARLEMGGAELVCVQDSLPREQWSRTGASRVEFMYRAAHGMTPRPLARIASGGEISRVMLACKVVFGNSDERETLVFDEVDAGVGGSVAVSLAGVLADLARTHQVIVVTHLPQVAVRGAVHYVVQKEAPEEGGNGIPQTKLVSVEGEDRVAELARMLSGIVDAASCAHARDMLESLAKLNG